MTMYVADLPIIKLRVRRTLSEEILTTILRPRVIHLLCSVSIEDSCDGNYQGNRHFRHTVARTFSDTESFGVYERLKRTWDRRFLTSRLVLMHVIEARFERLRSSLDT